VLKRRSLERRPSRPGGGRGNATTKMKNDERGIRKVSPWSFKGETIFEEKKTAGEAGRWVVVDVNVYLETGGNCTRAGNCAVRGKGS